MADSKKTFYLVLLSLIETPDVFSQRMTRLGFFLEDTDHMAARAPFTFKRGLTLKEARELADALQFAGARVAVREEGVVVDHRSRRKGLILPLESFTMCPQCGHKQPKAEACTRCGSLLGFSMGES